MSAHSPRLQFVIRLPDSPKTKVKGVILVEGPWYEKPGSPGLPFDLNRSLTFPGLFQLDGSCTSLGSLYFDLPIFFKVFVGRHRRGRLVSWVEKTRLDHIRRLLEIAERERNHEFLLFKKNLQELGASPFPYIVLVILRPLPEELIKGEHFILADHLKSIPGISSQAMSTKEALATFVKLDQSPLVVQDPKPARQATKKKKKKKGKKVGHVKATETGLEGFVDWVNPIPPTGETQVVRPVPQIASDSTEESEDNMFGLAAGFFAWMHKRAASAQGETTPSSKVPGGKCPNGWI